jgi:hypothetical protein
MLWHVAKSIQYLELVGRGRTVSRVLFREFRLAIRNTVRHLTTRCDTMRLGTRWVLVPKTFCLPRGRDPLAGSRIC